MVLRAEMRVFIIEHYFCSSSHKTVQERFANKFPSSVVPNKNTNKKIVDHFRTEFSVMPMKKNRPSSVLISKKLTELSTKIIDEPSTSIRKLAQQAQISKITVHRGLKNLILYSYRATLVQELK